MPRLRRLTCGILLALCVSLSAVAAADPQQELVQLARALRDHPSPAAYQRLARFAADTKDTETAAQASFALGLADFDQQRWPAARERFRAAAASAWLADSAAYFQARAESELGPEVSGREAALALLQSTDFSSSPYEDSGRALRAELLTRSGRAAEAADWLRRLPEVWSRPTLLLALARAQRAVGSVESGIAAAETLNYLYYNFPLSPEAAPANNLLAELRVELRANFPAPGEALRRARAEKLWALRAFRGARSDYLDLSVRSQEPTRSQARLRATAALFQLGEVRAACEELNRLGSVPAELEGEARAYRVRCDLRLGYTDRLEANLAELARNFAGSPWHQQALGTAANAALVRGDSAAAREYLLQLVEAAAAGDAADAHWRLTWLTYRSGDAAETARRLEEHLARFVASPFLPRALYWRARLALAGGEELLAERLLSLLRDWAPRDYVAQLAERLFARLQGAPAGAADVFPDWLDTLTGKLQRAPVPGLPGPLRTWVDKAVVLQRLARTDLAEQILATAADRADHPEIALARARLAYAQKKFARASELIFRANPDYWRYRLDDMPREAWEILYPRPYWSLIEREARRHGLDPYLVAGLIRQESRFEFDAVSSAGAVGLMQLMPGTARRLAGRRLSRSYLRDPETNIRLGTKYLAQLWQQYGGETEKAVAGYNAGGGRVGEWSALADKGDGAEFVESIPIEQTREFVHVVLRNYRFYRDLYADREEPRRRAELDPPPDDPSR
jgi:soluble lytic murein transglycosylase